MSETRSESIGGSNQIAPSPGQRIAKLEERVRLLEQFVLELCGAHNGPLYRQRQARKKIDAIVSDIEAR